MSSQPLPRPSSTKRGFRLTETGDIELLLVTFRYRIVTMEIIACLTGRSQASIYRRVAKLVSNKYLFRIVRPLQVGALTSTRKGIAALVARGLADTEALDKRFRAHELKASFPLFLEHEIALSLTHACLLLASRKTHIKLIDFEQGAALYDQVKNGRQTFSVRPDAKVTLQDTMRPEPNRYHALIEIDRSSCSRHRLAQRFKAYHAYFVQRLHTKKYGLTKPPRVVTICLTPLRAYRLAALAAEVLPPEAHKRFLFSSQDAFSLTNPTPLLEAPIFIRPGDRKDDARHHLITPIKDSTQREKA